jgi:hypothetical protein
MGRGAGGGCRGRGALEVKNTALAADPASFDDEERRFVDTIREHGWFHTHILEEPDLPGFAFTTGFWVSAGVPELIVFSLRNEVSNAILWDIYRAVAVGLVLSPGARLEGFANHPFYLRPVAKEHYPEHLGWSRWFYAGDDFPCLQLVWPDRSGAFPWEEGFDSSMQDRQPDLSDGVGE